MSDGIDRQRPLSAGLYLVATPIGSARDITLRALDILGAADILAAEDTRTLRRLMEIHGIPVGDRRVWSYHDHNGAAVRPRILEAIAAGQSVAYASDAGTPLIADPGFALARAVEEAGGAVTAAPGASAVLAALSLAGLPTDRFLFAGFLPPAAGARTSVLQDLAGVPATLVFFDTAKRCSRNLREMQAILGPRRAALCRELTKKFEEVRRGDLPALIAGCEADPPRGEIVIVVDRDRQRPAATEMEAALEIALQSMSVRDAAQSVAEALGLKKRDVYQAALRRASRDTGGASQDD